jgi:glycosyltransferase involved in cell wall biosynthesis
LKICLISENSYPVATGGVSEWCDYLVSGLKEYNFHIMTFAPQTKLKYKPPDNVESNLIEMEHLSFTNEKTINIIIKDLMQHLYPVLSGKPLDLEPIIKIIENEDISANKLISSHENQRILTSFYNKYYSDKPFVPFYYSWISLFYLFFKTLELFNQLPTSSIFHSLNSGYAGLLGSMGKVSTETPLIISEHGLYLKERLFELENSEVPRWLHPFYKKFFETLVRTSYKYVDTLTSVCLDHISYQKQIDSTIEPIVVYNGIDVKKFDFNYSNNKNEYAVGTVSRITPIKDQLTLIRSIPDVVQKNNVKFYIVGDIQDDEYYDECLDLTKDLEIKEYVEFIGFQESTKWYPRFDVFVLPSLSEGFPLVILEALSSGTPCVATKVGGVPEILDDRFLVDKWDSSDLASKISWLLEDSDLRKKIAYQGRYVVEKRFSVEKMVSEYRRIYEGIL